MSTLKKTKQVWSDMKYRCLNPSSPKFVNYGGRGIVICDRWRESFVNFLADMGKKPDGLTLERINNDGNYEPSNCRWASRAEQRLNQRDCNYFEFEGRRLPLEVWAREKGIHHATVRGRLRNGWSFEQAISITPDSNKNRMVIPATAAQEKMK